MFTRNIVEELTACYLIPARGGSKRIVDKNVQEIDGMPLVMWPVCEADEIGIPAYVSTDSLKISNAVNASLRVVTILDRPEELSQDDSSTWDLLEHHDLPYDLIGIRQPTSPFVGAETAHKAFALAAQTNTCVGLAHHELGRKTLHKSGLWVIPKDMIHGKRYMYAGNWIFLGVDSFAAVDIDTHRDLMEARELWAKLHR